MLWATPRLHTIHTMWCVVPCRHVAMASLSLCSRPPIMSTGTLELLVAPLLSPPISRALLPMPKHSLLMQLCRSTHVRRPQAWWICGIYNHPYTKACVWCIGMTVLMLTKSHVYMHFKCTKNNSHRWGKNGLLLVQGFKLSQRASLLCSVSLKLHISAAYLRFNFSKLTSF